MGTSADICTECGHKRYVHPPNGGCDIASHYYVDTCSCTGFKDANELPNPQWKITGPGSWTLPDGDIVT